MVASTENGKNSWPELVGVSGEVAAATIVRENPRLGTIIVKEGMMVTMDFRGDKVRILVDQNGVVKHIPRLG